MTDPDTAPSPDHPFSPASLAAELFDSRNLACPHAVWKKLRDQCPVPRVQFSATGRDGYLVTRKADIEYVASRPDLFTGEVDPAVWRWGGDFGPDFADIFADGGYDTVHTIVTSDPPKAHKYRKIVLEALSPKRINARKGDLQIMIDRLIAKLPLDGEPVDFRAEFAVPLPLLAIIDLFGLPEGDARFIYDFTCDYLNFVDPTTPVDVARDNARSLVAAQKYLAPMIEAYRSRPADNFLSFVANARDDGGAFLSMEEALSIAFITIIGGNETSRNAIATAAYHLARDKPLWHALVQDPSKIPNFAEETVRFGSPATVTPRQVVDDTELSGTKLEKGMPLYIMWGSGSQDDRFFEAPDEIRLDRALARNHTSFGSGVHHCAGIHLARAEIIQSVETWVRQFQSMDLAVPDTEIRYQSVWAIRALETLPLRLTRKQRSSEIAL